MTNTCILDSLDGDDTPPPILVGEPAPHSHLNEKLSETNELECSGSPRVDLVFLAPSMGVFDLERKRKDGLPLGIILYDPREHRIVVHTRHVE